MKICLISEGLTNPLDEGFKRFSFSLLCALSRQHRVLAMSKKGLSQLGLRVEAMGMNKLLLNWRLGRRIRQFAPEVICYVPSSSGTFYSFLRARMLRWYGQKARVILVSLQPRGFSPLATRWIPHLRPDVVLVQSHRTARTLEKLGFRADVLPSGVEMDRFAPVDQAQKQRLRRRYGVPLDAFLLLHVGHINDNRRVRLFKDLQGHQGTEVLLVGSTSTAQDEELVQELENAGVRIMRDYIPDIQEVYQLSDCYLFQVLSEKAAIELPLSVLEAMACNLPVISTRYGGLGDLFPEGDGFLFAETPQEVLERISLVKKGQVPRTRAMVEAFSWENVLETYWQKYLQ
jgi:glycosyltransferase involved in cell wall biosynthesis